MKNWGYDLLQVELGDNFKDNIMLTAYENADTNNEKLALYKLVELFNYYDMDVYKKIREAVYQELSSVSEWDNPTKRVNVLNDILNNLDKYEENFNKSNFM